MALLMAASATGSDGAASIYFGILCLKHFSVTEFCCASFGGGGES